MPLIPPQPQRPTFLRQIREQQRTERLRMKSVPPPENPRMKSREIVFSYSGHPKQDDVSGDYLIREPEAILTGVFITAKVAGATASTLVVQVNGASAYTLTMPAGETMVTEDALNLEVSEWDTVAVSFSASGANLSSVVVHIGYDVIVG